MRTILPKPSRYDWSALDATFARIHAEVRHEIGRKHDKERIAVHQHNIGVLLFMFLKIQVVIWVTGMLFVSITQ